jgi:hypothetical protein
LCLQEPRGVTSHHILHSHCSENLKSYNVTYFIVDLTVNTNIATVVVLAISYFIAVITLPFLSNAMPNNSQHSDRRRQLPELGHFLLTLCHFRLTEKPPNLVFTLPILLLYRKKFKILFYHLSSFILLILRMSHHGSPIYVGTVVPGISLSSICRSFVASSTDAISTARIDQCKLVVWV